MQKRLRTVLAWVLTLFLVVQPLISTATAEDILVTGENGNGGTTEVVDTGNGNGSGADNGTGNGNGGEPPANGNGGQEPVNGNGGQEPVNGNGGQEPVNGNGGQEPVNGNGGEEPAPIVKTPVALAELARMDVEVPNLVHATCDAGPSLNVDSLIYNGQILKVEYLDEWETYVIQNFNARDAAGQTVWVKVTFIENHEFDAVNSHHTWITRDEGATAQTKIVFNPAPTAEDCIEEVVLPAPETLVPADWDGQTEPELDELAKIEGVESVKYVVADDDVDEDDNAVEVVFAEGYEIAPESVDAGWDVREDGVAVATLQMQVGARMMLMAAGDDVSHKFELSDLVITPTELADGSDQVNLSGRFDAKDGEFFVAGEILTFTIDPQFEFNAVPSAPVMYDGVQIGTFEHDGSGVVTFTFNEEIENRADVWFTFSFWSTNSWVFTETDPEITIVVTHDGQEHELGPLTGPLEPEPTPTPPPAPPASDPQKWVWWTNPNDRGRTDPTEAIAWALVAPIGNTEGVTLTDTVPADAGWTVNGCGDPFTNYDVYNASSFKSSTDSVSVTCVGGVVTVEFPPYVSSNSDNTPRVVIYGDITRAPGDPIQDPDVYETDLFENTVVATEILDWEGTPVANPGGADASIEAGPRLEPDADPSKWGWFDEGYRVDADGNITGEGRESAEAQDGAIWWTVHAPPGPAQEIVIEDFAGDNWIWDCDSIVYHSGANYNGSGTPGAAPTVVCANDKITITFGPYTELVEWDTPGIDISATITVPQPANGRDVLTFENRATIISGKAWNGTEITPGGYAEWDLTQKTPDDPNTTPGKNIAFNNWDNGETIPHEAITWTITLPGGPNDGVRIVDQVPEESNWEFSCGSLLINGAPLAGNPAIDTSAGKTNLCSSNHLELNFIGYSGNDTPPVITIKANVLTEYDPQQVFSNTVQTFVTDWVTGSSQVFPGTQTVSRVQDQGFDVGGGGERGPVSIGDYVWIDVDRDGIQDADEIGIDDVVVNLYIGSTTGGDPVRTTTTTNGGWYGFKDLDSSTEYTLEFIKPDGYDWTLQSAGTDRTEDSDVDPDTGLVTFTSPPRGNNLLRYDEEGVPTGEADNPWLDAGVIVSKVSVGDYVWYDTNADGIQDASELPAENVKVELLLNGAVVGTKFTDSDGYYYFNDLDPNTDFQLRFTPPAGYIWTLQDQGSDDAADSDVDPATGLVSFTTPGHGLNQTEPDTMDIPTLDAGLVKPVSVGDYVWYDANRDGLQTPGEPAIPGVTVDLYRVVEGGTDVLVESTSTDGTGYYYFDDLLPSTDYRLVFTNPDPTLYNDGWTDQRVPEGDGTNDSDVDTNGEVTFTSEASGNNLTGPSLADNPHLDAGLLRKPVSVGDYVWYDVNRDGLQGDDEPAIEGVTVQLRRADDAFTTIATDVTDGDGWYSFTGLEPDTAYILVFVEPDGYNGWTTQNATGAATDDQGRTINDSDVNENGIVHFTSESTGDNLGDPNEADNPTLDAGLVKKVSIGDYVWYDDNLNGLQDEGEDRGVVGIKVTLYRVDGSEDPRETWTDSTGYYNFQDLFPGEDYYLVFEAPEDYGWTKQEQGGNRGTDSDVDRETGRTANFTTPDEGDNLIGPGRADNPRLDAGLVKLVSIGDRVWIDFDRNGEQNSDYALEPGIQGVAVSLYEIVDGEQVFVKHTVTDADGVYFFDDLWPGTDYQILFQIPATGLPFDGGTYTGWEFTEDSGGAEVDASGTDSDADQETGWTVVFTTPITGDNQTDYNETDLPQIDAGIRPLVSLGDYVWIDWNRDGLQDDDEPGVENATVTLYSVKDGVVTFVGTTTTDANGEYSFVDLDPTLQYQVKFELPETILGAEGWVFTQQVGTILDGGNSDAYSADRESVNYGWTVVFDVPEYGDNFSHEDGEVDRPEIDAGVIPLVSLGDYVWIDWNRDGLQDDDEPGVAGVTVRLNSVKDGVSTFVGTTTTDADGGYSFVDLDPTLDYQVKFELPETILGTEGWVFTQQVGTILDGNNSDANDARGTADYGWTVVFDVPEYGDNLSHEDGLVDRPEIDAGVIPLVSLGDYVWIDWNRDGLQDDDEPGVEGVIVTLHRTDGENAGVVGTTTTDANGGYSFVDLDPTGTYRVQFELPTDGDGNVDVLGFEGWMFTKQVGTILDGDNSDANNDRDSAEYGWTVEFTLPEYGDNFNHESEDGVDRPEIDAGIIPLVSIGDFVWDDENRDGIQDPGEPGVPGVKVTITGPDGFEEVTYTDEDGYYSFKDLIPDTEYEITFEKPDGYAGWTDKEVGDDPSKDSNVDPDGKTTVVTPELGNNKTEPGEADDPTIDAGLIRLISVGDYVWYDYNRNGIQDEGEMPIAGVKVTITGPEGFTDSTTTDEDGYYYFKDLIPETEYTITFEKPDGYTEWTIPFAGDDEAVDSNVDETGAYTFTTPKHGNNLIGPDETDDPTIDAGLVIKVSVGDYVWYDYNRNGIQDEGEQPAPGIKVHLYQGEKLIGSTETDEDGYYYFKDLYPSTEYTLVFERPAGYLWTQQGAGSDGSVDSDVNRFGVVTFTTPPTGDNLIGPDATDLPTLDAGLVKKLPGTPDPEKDPEPVKELPSTGVGTDSNALSIAMASIAGMMLAAVAFRMNAYKRS